jgi:pyruvate dehydrogenase E2 component (dihydrolipoamide acetyltransferase)
MPHEIIMPKLGLTMTEGKLLDWLKKEGEKVRAGDVVAQIETDKVVTDIEAPGDGELVCAAEPSAVLPVATVIGYVLVSGESKADIPDTGRRPAETPTRRRQPVSSDQTEADSEARTPERRSGRVIASPRARRLAKELGIDLSQVAPSHPTGKVTVEDVERAAKEVTQGEQIRVTPVVRKMIEAGEIAAEDLSEVAQEGRIRRSDVEQILRHKPVGTSPADAIEVRKSVPLAGTRELIASRMTESARTVPAVTLESWTDATELISIRQRLHESAPALGLERVSYDCLFVLAVANALRDHPHLNSRLNGNVIEELASINIAVAVDTPRGLLTVVVRDADNKSWIKVCRELADLVGRAVDGKARLEDLEGGTFTISNLGMFGIHHFTPIINLPQCAILGLGEFIEWPSLVEGKLTRKFLLPLSLTFDHRIVDGAAAARFLQDLRRRLEDPLMLVIASEDPMESHTGG